eukprot:349990-Chlamydomonas_euryale.AAC.15
MTRRSKPTATQLHTPELQQAKRGHVRAHTLTASHKSLVIPIHTSIKLCKDNIVQRQTRRAQGHTTTADMLCSHPGHKIALPTGTCKLLLLAEARSVSQLILHGRQVPGMLPCLHRLQPCAVGGDVHSVFCCAVHTDRRQGPAGGRFKLPVQELLSAASVPPPMPP